MKKSIQGTWKIQITKACKSEEVSEITISTSLGKMQIFMQSQKVSEITIPLINHILFEKI